MYGNLRFLVILGLAALVAGCEGMDEFPFSKKSRYPGTLDETGSVEENRSVLLVGIRGPLHVDYIQYCSSSCKNYKFTPRTDDVVALLVPVPHGDLELNSYTVAERPAGRFVSSYGYTREYGYLAVDDDPQINVDVPGVYYHLTFNSKNGTFTTEPDEELLRMAKDRYGAMLSGLKPANFKWPE